MKQYEVLISDKANEDMEAIFEYISDKLPAPASAIKRYDRIADAVLSLEEMPDGKYHFHTFPAGKRTELLPAHRNR